MQSNGPQKRAAGANVHRSEVDREDRRRQRDDQEARKHHLRLQRCEVSRRRQVADAVAVRRVSVPGPRAETVGSAR